MAGEMMETNQNLSFIPISLEWGDDSWRKQAACRGISTEEFFKEQVPKAKQICESCPVKSACLQFALTNDIGWGIYGGMTSKERRRAFKYVVSKR
jgi:WhiB family redox-sensing transcriptional regulator